MRRLDAAMVVVLLAADDGPFQLELDIAGKGAAHLDLRQQADGDPGRPQLRRAAQDL